MKPHGTYKLYHRRYRHGVASGRATRPARSTESATSAASAASVGSAAAAVLDAYVHPVARGEERVRRILESLRSEIVEGGRDNLRIRQIFREPREMYRLELELPELGYQRTTLLDREALEELLEADDVRAVVASSSLGH